MTLPVSGAISFNAINVELGVAGTTQASLGQASYRTLAGVPSGAISMSNFYGKSNRVALSYTYSANTANAALNLSAIAGYVSGKSDITVTINSGVYVYSTSTGGYGLNITGGATGDTLTIVNNGYIMGMGGLGGTYYSAGGAQNGAVGGPAINFGFALSGATITNTSGYIGGGGGGGGGGDGYTGGGGGAGGGRGGDSAPGSATGGAGGSPGSSGAAGVGTYYQPAESNVFTKGGGGGGRIMPGTGGTGPSPGADTPNGGGSGGGGGTTGQVGGTAGYGGSGGSAGGNGSGASGAGGGGYGASGGASNNSSGGGGGKAVNLNAKTITWTGGASSSSRAYGAVS